MNKRKIKLFILVSVIAIIVLVCLKIYNQRLIYESRVFVAEKENYLQSFFSNDDLCIIRKGDTTPLVLPHQYVIDSEMDLNYKYVVKRGDGYNNTLRRLNVYVQDISSLEVVKKIDLKALLDPYMQEYQVVVTPLIMKRNNGIYYLVKPLSKRYSKSEMRKRYSWSFTERKEIWINIETEEVQLRDLTENNNNNYENIWMLVGTAVVSKSISENARIGNSDYLDHTSYISIPTADLPENNKKLYEMFPELKKTSREDGVYAHIFLTPQTNNLEALSLILDDNQDLDFSVLEPDDDGYYGRYPINGENHYITKEDYEQFQEEYWEYRKKQREKYGIEEAK